MRRPLFWVALFLVLITAVRLKMGVLDAEQPGVVRVGSLETGEKLTVTGQVYKKDNQTIYLQDISVHLDSQAGISRQNSQADIFQQNSRVSNYRQSISCEDNLICKLTDTDSMDDILLGSHVTLEGIFSTFSSATNPGEFDALTYYQTIGVGGRINRAKVLESGKDYWPVREFLYGLRLKLEERLYRALPESQAGILCALLLGEKDGLDDQVKELYRRNGILHILSISSLHITILGMSIYGLLRRMRAPVWVSALAGSVLLLLYGALTGFGLSACRAIGMYLIRMLGEVIGRTYDMLTALGVVAAVMVFSNPWYLNHSGFLLSFSSVLGIGVLCPALMGQKKKGSDQLLWWERIWEGLGQSVAASFSVVAVTMPVQLWFYYEVPVYAVFLNLLVLPLVKPLMLLGFIVLLIPGFSPAGFGAGIILRFYELLCERFGKLPFHTWNPGCPKLWQIGVYYLLLAAVVVIKGQLERRESRERRERRGDDSARSEGKTSIKSSRRVQVSYSWENFRRFGRKIFWEGFHKLSIKIPWKGFPKPREEFPCEGFHKLCMVFPWIGIVCAMLVLWFRPSVENQVAFLDVGQGDCILVRTASGENYLFDCGSASRSNVGEYVLIPYLKYYGIRKLDAVFVSHPDKDHVSGILELLKMGEEGSVKVCQLVLPGIAKQLREEQLGQLVKAADADEQDSLMEIRWLAAGDSWQVGSASFLCLHPKVGSTLEDSNAYSECVYVEFRESRKKWNQTQPVITMLLTGDVEGEGERALLEELKIHNIQQVDVLKVAHHGSRGTTSQDLLEQIRPVVSVISSGRNNSYGHPHKELLERLDEAGSMIFGTAQRGAVTLRFQKGEILAEAFLKAPNL